MKVACIGSNLESKIALQGLVEAGCDIKILITRPKGTSKGISDYVDLHPFCKKNKIKCITTTDVNDPDFIKRIRAENLDYLFTLGWSQLFKKEFINSFSKMVVGSHPTPLPKRRGRAPVAWTILFDIKKSAVSFFKIDEGADTGKIITRKWFDIPDEAFAEEVYKKVADKLKEGFIELYQRLEANEDLEFEDQDEADASYTGKRVPDDGIIDFSQSNEEIFRLIRAVSNPYPGAFSYYNHKKVIIWGGRLPKSKENSYHGTVGQILKKQDNALLVQTGKGNLWIEKLTDEYGNPLAINTFKIGHKFGYNHQIQIHKLLQSSK